MKALEKDREERYQISKDSLLDVKKLKQRLEFETELERSGQPAANGRGAITESEGAITAGNAPQATVGARPAPIESGAISQHLFVT